MTLAVCTQYVQFLKFPSLTSLGTYEPPPESLTIRSISWCCEGKKLLVLTQASAVIVKHRNEQSIEPIEVFTNKIDRITMGVYSNSDPDLMAFGGESGEVLIYDNKSKSRIDCDVVRVPGAVENIEFSPDDANVAIACNNGQIYLLDKSKLNLSASISSIDDVPVSAMSYGKNPSRKELIAVAGRDGSLTLCDIESLDNVFSCKYHKGKVTDVAFFNSNLISIGIDGRFNEYDVRCPESITSYNLDDSLSSMAFLKGTNNIVVGTITGQLKTYDNRNMSMPVKTMLVNPNGSVKKVSFCNTEEDLIDFHSDDITTNLHRTNSCDFNTTPLFSDKDSTIFDDFNTTIKPQVPDLRALFKESLDRTSGSFQNKLNRSFYTLRIDASKQFIGLEARVTKTWNEFVEYLKASGDDFGKINRISSSVNSRRLSEDFENVE